MYICILIYVNLLYIHIGPYDNKRQSPQYSPQGIHPGSPGYSNIRQSPQYAPHPNSPGYGNIRYENDTQYMNQNYYINNSTDRDNFYQ
jgi:hypothetical protein